MTNEIQNEFQKGDVVVFTRDFEDEGFSKGDYAKILWASKTSVGIAYNGVHFVNRWFQVSDFVKVEPPNATFIVPQKKENFLTRIVNKAVVRILIKIDNMTR